MNSPMLSLDKTKEREVLRGFVGSHNTLLSWKMDGLTIVLTYENGELQKAVTRGNGIVGEVITNNAQCFSKHSTENRISGKTGTCVERQSLLTLILNE